MDAMPILIVENYAILREILRLILELEGYIVYEARDGCEALHYLRASAQPLIVLLDWHLPGLPGRAALYALAADAPQARRHAYILYTAASCPLDLLAQVPPGFRVTTLSKFSGVDELLYAVKQAINQIAGDR